MIASESRFETKALGVLEACLEAVEDGGGLDADLAGGVLTLRGADGATWVLNKHAPMRQLWLSSPLSGASHYILDEASGAWRDTRGGPTLLDRLAEELGRAAGRVIKIDA